MNWININLPWTDPILYKSNVKFPMYPRHVYDYATSLVGDPEEYFAKNAKAIDKCSQFYYELDYNKLPKDQQRYSNRYSELLFMKKYHGDKPFVKKALEYKRLKDEHQAIVESHPDYIKYVKEYKDVEEREAQKSFCGRGLNKVGTLIEVEDYFEGKRKTTKQFLIGDVNRVGGVCDDCTGFDTRTAIVKRYCIIWSDINGVE